MSSSAYLFTSNTFNCLRGQRFLWIQYCSLRPLPCIPTQFCIFKVLLNMEWLDFTCQILKLALTKPCAFVLVVPPHSRTFIV